MRGRKHLHLPEFEALDIELAPMIDLVFLLLIFFMTSSTMISFVKDRRVALPVSAEARVPRVVGQRLVLNVYKDGTWGDERGRQLTEADVEHALANARRLDTATRLQIRADRETAHGAVKRLLAASRRAGITDVLFSTFTSEAPAP